MRSPSPAPFSKLRIIAVAVALTIGVVLLLPSGKPLVPGPATSPSTVAAAGAATTKATAVSEQVSAAAQCLNPASQPLREFLATPGLRLEDAGAYLRLEEASGATVQEDLVIAHYRDAGRDYRVQIFGEPEEGGERARFFTVGTDELPDPAPVPAGVDARSAESAWEYLRGREVHWIQRNRVIRLEDGASATLVTENETVAELQIRDKSGARWVCAFGTTPDPCRCL